MNNLIKFLIRDVDTIRKMRDDSRYTVGQITPIIRIRDRKIYELRINHKLTLRMIAGIAEISGVTVHNIVKKYARLHKCEKLPRS